MLKDSLHVLMLLSKYLQSDNLNVSSAQSQIDTTKNKLLGLKVINGDAMTVFFDQYKKDGMFEGIPVIVN